MDIPHRLSRALSKRLGDDLKEIRLFGSRAKGTWGPGSDYDILVVVSRRTASLLDAIYDEGFKLELRFGVDISFKVYGEEEYRRRERLGTPFAVELRASSIRL